MLNLPQWHQWLVYFGSKFPPRNPIYGHNEDGYCAFPYY
uniref:Uncharacterized protein n=1 Tax=Tetranychus urticae TaxID=32264 RepID=T1KPP7_TETUR